jgi:hypothetical protein
MVKEYLLINPRVVHHNVQYKTEKSVSLPISVTLITVDNKFMYSESVYSSITA